MDLIKPEIKDIIEACERVRMERFLLSYLCRLKSWKASLEKVNVEACLYLHSNKLFGPPPCPKAPINACLSVVCLSVRLYLRIRSLVFPEIFHNNT